MNEVIIKNKRLTSRSFLSQNIEENKVLDIEKKEVSP
jgi:hypothetical protein